jgi:hypothetical protein
MLFVTAIVLSLIGTGFYYLYTKQLRECVSYSKAKSISILGHTVRNEVLLISDITFVYKLLRSDVTEGVKDTEQKGMLSKAKRLLQYSLAIGTVAAVFGVVHVATR